MGKLASLTPAAVYSFPAWEARAGIIISLVYPSERKAGVISADAGIERSVVPLIRKRN